MFTYRGFQFGALFLLAVSWVGQAELARSQETAELDSEARTIDRASLSSCDYLWTRKLANRLRVTPLQTQALAMARALEGGGSISLSGGVPQELRVTLATGEIHGAPYDAMGVGTYIEVTPQEWVTICGVTFKGGSLTVTKHGFEFSTGTDFMVSPPALDEPKPEPES